MEVEDVGLSLGILGKSGKQPGAGSIEAVTGSMKGTNMSQLRKLMPLFCAPLLWLAAPSAYGQATRTWVSGVGDDANPCSRTAPCKTFAGAISKTAAGGEIDVLDPGGFGAVTITKAISIEATEGIAGVLTSGTNGIVIQAGASDQVVLRGLTFNGLGTSLSGIDVKSAGKVVVENCFISEFGSAGDTTRAGITIEPSAADVQVFISNTKIQENTTNGIVVMPTIPHRALVTLDDVGIVGSTNNGLSISAGGLVVVRNSNIAGNAGSTGYANLRADGTGGTTSVVLDNVAVSEGSTGILAVGGAVVRVAGSSIINNALGVSATGGAQILSFGNNRLAANVSNGAFSGTASMQ